MGPQARDTRTMSAGNQGCPPLGRPGGMACLHPDLGLSASRLWHNRVLLFGPTQFVVHCYSCHSNLIHQVHYARKKKEHTKSWSEGALSCSSLSEAAPPRKKWPHAHPCRVWLSPCRRPPNCPSSVPRPEEQGFPLICSPCLVCGSCWHSGLILMTEAALPSVRLLSVSPCPSLVWGGCLGDPGDSPPLFSG